MVSNVRAFLEADKAELMRLLQSLPEDEIITRMSLQSRLEEVDEELTNLSENISDTLSLTFRGKPVEGTRGIYADFAAKAMTVFSDAFAAFAAITSGHSLARTGQIPDADKNRLLITQIAVGSFGFKLQLPTVEDANIQGSLLNQDTDYITDAKEKLEQVISSAINGDDEQLADSLADIDQRAIGYVQNFFDVLNMEDAYFTLDTGTIKISCTDREVLQNAYARLQSDNIRESDVPFKGQFTGVLPTHRDFEFVTEYNEIIKGKISKCVDIPGHLFSMWQDKLVNVLFHSRSLGSGRPRYTLEDLENVSQED